MANQDQVTILKKQGVEAWNQWREQQSIFMADPIDLTKADLSGLNLSNANLEGVRLNNANLSRAKLDSTALSDAHLDDANLSGAELTHANLFRATMYRANLSGATLNFCDFTAANLTDADLANCDLANCDLNNTKLTGAKLSNTKLPVAPGEVRKEELKDLPRNTEISIVYRPGLTAVSLHGKYLGVEGGNLKMQVYRTVNFGKQIGFDDIGNRRLEDYTPSEEETSNVQKLGFSSIEQIFRLDR